MRIEDEIKAFRSLPGGIYDRTKFLLENSDLGICSIQSYEGFEYETSNCHGTTLFLLGEMAVIEAEKIRLSVSNPGYDRPISIPEDRPSFADGEVMDRYLKLNYTLHEIGKPGDVFASYVGANKIRTLDHTGIYIGDSMGIIHQPSTGFPFMDDPEHYVDESNEDCENDDLWSSIFYRRKDQSS